MSSAVRRSHRVQGRRAANGRADELGKAAADQHNLGCAWARELLEASRQDLPDETRKLTRIDIKDVIGTAGGFVSQICIALKEPDCPETFNYKLIVGTRPDQISSVDPSGIPVSYTTKVAWIDVGEDEEDENAGLMSPILHPLWEESTGIVVH